jgi:hypothetical protein
MMPPPRPNKLVERQQKTGELATSEPPSVPWFGTDNTAKALAESWHGDACCVALRYTQMPALLPLPGYRGEKHETASRQAAQQQL